MNKQNKRETDIDIEEKRHLFIVCSLYLYLVEWKKRKKFLLIKKEFIKSLYKIKSL